MLKWRLFVDESGAFDRANDDVVTAGLLVPAGVAGISAAHIRNALESALPGVPWPLHAAYLNRPVLFALVAAANHRRLSGSTEPAPSLDPVVHRALVQLAELEPVLLTTALADLAEGKWPDFAVIERLDRRLRESSPALHAELAARVRSARATVARVIVALAERARAAGHPLLGFAAGEGLRGDAGGGDPGSDLGYDRYASCLRELLQRVVDAVARLGGKHEIWLQVLSRPLIDPHLKVRVQLHLRHVGGIVGSLDLPERVRIVIERVPYFDDRADPVLVLADFASNTARHPLRSRHAPLRKVEEKITDRIGVPVRGGEPVLSNLAATGRAAAALRSVRAGQPLDRTALAAARVRRWACDQAVEWSEVLKP